MIAFAINHPEKLVCALVEHIELVLLTLGFSLFLAAGLSILSMLSAKVSQILISFFSMLYSIPSLAFFALLIPVTGLGTKTAVIVLVLYNQYILLHNFMAGLTGVDSAIVEAARGLGMTSLQILFQIRLPLSKRALFVGIRLAVISTISIAAIAASINAGGLGTLLFDGLRTLNTVKILWGGILSSALAILTDGILRMAEKKIK